MDVIAEVGRVCFGDGMEEGSIVEFELDLVVVLNQPSDGVLIRYRTRSGLVDNCVER